MLVIVLKLLSTHWIAVSKHINKSLQTLVTNFTSDRIGKFCLISLEEYTVWNLEDNWTFWASIFITKGRRWRDRQLTISCSSTSASGAQWMPLFHKLKNIPFPHLCCCSFNSVRPKGIWLAISGLPKSPWFYLFHRETLFWCSILKYIATFQAPSTSRGWCIVNL